MRERRRGRGNIKAKRRAIARRGRPKLKVRIKVRSNRPSRDNITVGKQKAAGSKSRPPFQFSVRDEGG